MRLVGDTSGDPMPSRKAQRRARKRVLEAMSDEQREAFLRRQAEDAVVARFVRRALKTVHPLVTSSPMQGDLWN